MELMIMKPYFEYSDTLNSPYEAFIFEAEHSEIFPVRSHWHYFMEILYLIEGQAYVEAGKETGTGRSDHILFSGTAQYISLGKLSPALLCLEI